MTQRAHVHHTNACLPVIPVGRLATIAYADSAYCRCRTNTDTVCIGKTFACVLDHIYLQVEKFLEIG